MIIYYYYYYLLCMASFEVVWLLFLLSSGMKHCSWSIFILFTSNFACVLVRVAEFSAHVLFCGATAD